MKENKRELVLLLVHSCCQAVNGWGAVYLVVEVNELDPERVPVVSVGECQDHHRMGLGYSSVERSKPAWRAGEPRVGVDKVDRYCHCLGCSRISPREVGMLLTRSMVHDSLVLMDGRGDMQ